MSTPPVTPQPSRLPLAGVRVADLTRALAGPYAATLLADLGADVVKIEPLAGDMTRSWGPFKDDTSLYHLSVNRNKRSVSLDFRSPEGIALLHRIVDGCDLVLANFRPGVLEQLELSAEDLARRHPGTVLTTITGFGSFGPLAETPAFDQVAQGMGGLMSLTGTDQPVRSGVPLADVLAGMFGALGACAALVGRSRSGHAAAIETSLLESVMATLVFQAQRYLSLDEVPSVAGNDHPVLAPYGVYTAADTKLIIAVGTEAQWNALCRVLSSSRLATDERFVDGDRRNRNRDVLRDAIEGLLAARRASDWLELLRAAAVPSGPLHDLEAVFADPQVQALAVAATIEHPDLGEERILRGPFHVDGAATGVRRVPPRLGEDTIEVLNESGLEQTEIDQLLHDGVIATATTKVRT